MARGEINLKSFYDVRAFLQGKNQPTLQLLVCVYSQLLRKNRYDLVYEGIYLGEASPALRPELLKYLNVTHVINASQGSELNQINTNSEFYKDAGILFHGIPAEDVMTYNIFPYLRPAAEFMHTAQQEKGIVYVHCQQGVSRSATVVLAYLMLYKNMSLIDAVKAVREKREIYPNEGFLKQLCRLEMEIEIASESI